MLAAPPFNYLETLDRVDEAIESNAELAREIVKSGLVSFNMLRPENDHHHQQQQEPTIPAGWEGVAKFADVDKARSTLRQFYRDWSAAGARERDICYGPVIRAVEGTQAAREPGQPPLRVLVPGAGLGRLVLELCLRGCEAEGNEISYHQLLASSYVLNSCGRAGRHTIYPWAHGFSNHRTREDHLRGYAVPDVHPATALAAAGARAGSMSMCAADFLCLYGDVEHASAYDAVAAVFFLDTAPNLIRYLATIRHCLRPGGVLVNVGPLLWHFEDQAPGNGGLGDDGDGEHDPGTTTGIADPGSFELADDEVRALVERLGFEVMRWESGVDAPYIQNAESMLLTTFKASSWVARKVDES